MNKSKFLYGSLAIGLFLSSISFPGEAIRFDQLRAREQTVCNDIANSKRHIATSVREVEIQTRNMQAAGPKWNAFMPQFTASVAEFRQIVASFPTLSEPLRQEDVPHFSHPGFTFVQDLQIALDTFSNSIDPSRNPFLQGPRPKIGLLSSQLSQAKTKITDLLGQFSEDFGGICDFLVADYEGERGAMPHLLRDVARRVAPQDGLRRDEAPRRTPAVLAAGAAAADRAAARPAQQPSIAAQGTDLLAAFSAQFPGGTSTSSFTMLPGVGFASTQSYSISRTRNSSSSNSSGHFNVFGRHS